MFVTRGYMTGATEKSDHAMDFAAFAMKKYCNCMSHGPCVKIHRSCRRVFDVALPMTDPWCGAARLMVLHGSYQEKPQSC